MENPNVAKLPSPPDDVGLVKLFGYIVKLITFDKTTHWMIVTALLSLVVGKASGMSWLILADQLK